MTSLYLIVTALMGVLLLLLLLRPGGVRPLTLWLFAGLLPVLVAVTAALFSQQEAQAALVAFDAEVKNRGLGWRDATGAENTATVALGGLDAACVVRASARGGTYRLSSSTLFVPRDVQLIGPWPSPAEAEALMVSGQQGCRRLSGKDN
jgi:hypothetical protein